MGFLVYTYLETRPSVYIVPAIDEIMHFCSQEFIANSSFAL